MISQAVRAKNDTQEVQIQSGEVTLTGDLYIPYGAITRG